MIASRLFAKTLTATMLGLLAVLTAVWPARGGVPGTAFTYQGRLTEAGEPVTSAAPVNLAFRLYDAETAGTLLDEQAAPGFSAFDDDGRFAIDLDFGDVFNGEERWLEVWVDGVPLLPRQAVMPTPYALRALNVAIVPDSALSGAYSNALTMSNAANQITGSFTGSGAGLTGLNASSITTGTLGSLVLSGTYSNALNLSNPANIIFGSGAGLTNLNANNLASDTVPSARLSGTYSNALTLSNPANMLFGNGANLTALNAGNISTGTLPIVRGGTGASTAPGALTNLNAQQRVTGTAPAGNYITAINADGSVITAPDGNSGGDITGVTAGAGLAGGGASGAVSLNVAANGIINTMLGSDALSLNKVSGGAMVSSGGNIGIGIANPTRALHVVSSDPAALLVDNPSTSTLAIGVHGLMSSTASGATSAAVRGENRGTGANNIGVFGTSVGGYGVFGYATGTSGINYGVFGQCFSPEGYAGYFLGARNYFEGNVGMGTTAPTERLHIQGTHANGEPFLRIHNQADEASSLVLSTGFHTYQIGQNQPGGTGPLDAFFIRDASAAADRMVILTNGNVGIGESIPGAKLHVNGTTRTDILEITGADLAEEFPFSDKVEPGMVVAIDAANPGKLCLSRGAYNKRVAGVIAGANDFSTGVVLGRNSGSDSGSPVALTGRVYVWCDAAAAPIEPGDMLTTSDRPGHAMAVADHSRAHGAIIGKAMTALDQGESGLVLVLVNLQ